MPNKRSVHDVVEFKADAAGKGTFTALVAAYGNVDLQGDRIVPGAFDKSIATWKKSGDPIPVIWSHDWANPHAHVGAVDPANVRSTRRGLEVSGKFDLDDPFASKVYQLVKQRRVKQWSFAYEIEDERLGEDGANELWELGITETGPTLKGANVMTGTLAVKNDETNGNGKQPPESEQEPKAEPESKAEPEADGVKSRLDEILSRLDAIEARLPAKADDPTRTPDDEDLDLETRIAKARHELGV